jgi:GH15 family glucan-1,4-alpha-glucosidase
MAYQPIENYGIIGNAHSAALVGMNGSIDWLCFPHLDSPTIFAALLDDNKGGASRLLPPLSAASVNSTTGPTPMS